MPIDRLKFEREKRQHEISRLQGEIQRVEAERLQWLDWYDRELERHRAQGYAYGRNFENEGYSDNGMINQIMRLERDVSGVQSEITAIDKALSEKWK